jgi:endonuclease G
VPTGTPDTNDLIVRDIYALSSNDHTKFADWVAYRLDASMDDFQGQRQRNWAVDPALDPSETLEKDDYTGAFAALSTHRGHQAPLETFSGTADWRQVNFLSNITPQKWGGSCIIQQLSNSGDPL